MLRRSASEFWPYPSKGVKKGMKIRKISLPSVFFMALLSMPMIFSQEKGPDVKKETVLDRRIHLEQELITEIPAVDRLCGKIDLIRRGWVRVGDTSLYCEEEGPMPMVLLHGGPGATHHYFHPYFSRAGKFSRVITYDQRGTGISDYVKGEGYSLPQAAADLDNLRLALGIKKWVVLGHSYGGLLAQYYATKYPEYLAGLVLVGSSLGEDVPLMPTRQYDFISKEENEKMKEIRMKIGELMKEKKIAPEKMMEILVFNNHINGDWKRQNYYRPSMDDLARMALYEWKHASDYRADMGGSIGLVDLEGAFKSCPIPTMIMEGKWDLTWNTDKPGILQNNHPGSQLIMFENSSHNPFQDEPEKFFRALQDFIWSLPDISTEQIKQWKNDLEEWKKQQEMNPSYILRTAGWGSASMAKLAGQYSPGWLTKVNYDELLKLGKALYEVKRYREALTVFKKLGAGAKAENDKISTCSAMIWQAHMLDLIGERKQAVAIYREVAAMNFNVPMRDDQLGLVFEPSGYAAERIKKPFTRLENKRRD